MAAPSHENADAAASEVTHRRVLAIAIPIVLANATVPILGAVDTGVVGQTPETAPIGAVGMGAAALSAIYWIFGFLRMGTVGLTAQASGNNDSAEVDALLTRGLLIGAAGGLLIILLQLPLFWGALQAAPGSVEVEGLARDYMAIRVWSAPAAISLFAITGWLIAQERTRAVLVIQLWMNGLNIVLDLWFVLGLGWQVQGVAIATFLAEWTGLALGLWFCRATFRGNRWRNWVQVFDRPRWLRMAQLNGDIMIRSLLLEAIFVSFLFMGAGLGDATLAANQVLLQFLMITAYGMDGFAFAAEALVGKAMGARQPAAVRRASVMVTIWTVSTAVLMAVGFSAFGSWLVAFMAKAKEAQVVADVYLPYMVAAPLLGCAAWTLDGIFIGATRSTDMRNMTAISFLVYVVAAGLLVPAYDNHGLWMALLISFVARGVTLGLRYPALERAAAPSA